MAAVFLEGLQQGDAGHRGGLIVRAFDEDALGGDHDPLLESLECRIEFEIGIVVESEFGVDFQADVLGGGGALGDRDETLGEADDLA